MKVSELMERAGISQTGRAIAYIKDGLDEINMMGETHVTTQRINIVADQRFYDLPMDVIKVLDIRCQHHENDDSKYRSIPRTIKPPATEDSDGV